MRSLITEIRRPSQVGKVIAESRGRPDGIVLVFGTGLNIQASLIEKRGRDDDWAGLLDHIAAEIGLTEQQRSHLPSSFLARWECLLTGFACANGIEPQQAEDRLQLQIVKGLRKLEELTHGFSLYRELAACGLTDLISLNFDRRTALSLGSEKFVSARTEPELAPSTQTLYRHSRIVSEQRVTRIWYPHGDTKRADTVKLGVRRYGFHLGVLREYFGYSDRSWRVHVPWNEDIDDKSKALADREDDDPNLLSWVEAFVNRPLLFLGCGLGADEWSLWWLLRYRSSQRQSQPAYFLYVGRVSSTVEALARTVGLQPVPFHSHDELWAIVREAIA